MAEKSFGVKEINLIGASGTPTIESPNNLNLNAVNVAISTNVTIGGTLTVSGNVSVGGTLTYEDVTNIDSVGVITARSGVDVDDFISVGGNIHLGNAGIITATSFSGPATQITVTDESSDTMTFPVFVTASISGGLIQTANLAPQAGSNLYFNSSTGQLSASSFNAVGQTSNLSLSNTSVQVSYVVTANGSSAYRFAGNGVVSTADNPDLYLIRGQKYRFINNSGGSHPFQIREASGGTAYSTGVTNNGAASGNIDFAPTFDSPAQLVYQCTAHGGMVGNIYLRGGNGNETNVGVTTFAATGSNPFIQQWRLTSNKSTSSSSSDISANLEVVDSDGYGGTNGTMTESSGVFTFPSTGIYLIMAKGSYSASGSATSIYNEMDLHTTTDGSSFNRAAIGWCYIASGGYGTAACDFVFNVTNTSTHKVKFRGTSASSNAYLTANTNDNQTHFTFMRIAAT